MKNVFDDDEYRCFPDDDDDEVLSAEEVEKEKSEENNLNNSMSTNPFNTQTFQPSSPWGTSSQTSPNTYSPWGTSSRSTYQPSFGTPGYSPWGSSNSNYGSTQYRPTCSNPQQLDRKKRIIFCDLLDNLVESREANNRLGVQPRGLYDIRLRLEVWDKIAQFSPDYVFVLSNVNLGSNKKQFVTMVDYVMYSLADYVRLPYDNCRSFIKQGYDIYDPCVKPGTGLIEMALNSIPGAAERYRKSDMLVIGVQGGLGGQNNRDSEMAAKFGIDYIDIGQLLSSYI